MDGDLGRVVDETGAVYNLECDILAGSEVCDPCERVSRLSREALESCCGSLAAWDDADVVRSLTTAPAQQDRLALDDGGWGDDSEFALSISCRDGREECYGSREGLHGERRGCAGCLL